MKIIENNKEEGFDLYAALKSLPGIKNLKRTKLEDIKKLPLSEQSPADRRFLIYLNNTRN